VDGNDSVVEKDSVLESAWVEGGGERAGDGADARGEETEL
jgi:hypothetical protein